MKHGLLRDIRIAIVNTLAGAALLFGGVVGIQALEEARFGPASQPAEVNLTIVKPKPSPGASPEGEIGEAVASRVDPITGATYMVVLMP